MNQYLLTKESKELSVFPHIVEFGLKKINTIQFDSLKKQQSSCLRFYYVMDGRFEWYIKNQIHSLFPGDLAIVYPGQYFGNEKGFMEIGTVYWIQLQWLHSTQSAKETLRWSRFSSSECQMISRVLSLNNALVLSRFKEAISIFQTIHQEFQHQEMGYNVRVNLLLDELLILVARRLMQQQGSGRDFPQIFLKLEQQLRANLSHQWTVEEMAALIGSGTTAFSEKVKNYTGFSPLNYLINIRISEAIKLLKQQNKAVTDIALDVGFYSSQHFATTFKKLTGYTPSEFRKKNITDN